jgi:peptidoglycan/xylan/chitin deacetylase (PgdA/CDA1 family)
VLAALVAAGLAVTAESGGLVRAGVRRPPRAAATARLPYRIVPSSRLRGELVAVRRLAAHGLPLFCGGPSKRLVALTFDDGPGPYTKLAIAKLHVAHARATFFLVGKQVRAYPGLAALERRVAAVGDHTMTHPFLPALAAAAMKQQIAGAKTLVERASGQPVVLFRPPYEGRTSAIEREVRGLGMLEVLWNVDSADSLGANYARIERNVLAGLRPGSIILMHENRGQTIRALPVIFAALARDHLRAVTVPDLVATDPPSPAGLRAGLSGCNVIRHIGDGDGDSRVRPSHRGRRSATSTSRRRSAIA